MKRLFKIFFTILCFFIPIFASAVGIEQSVITNVQPQATFVAPASNKQKQITLNTNKQNESIVTYNSRGIELSTIKNRKNSQHFGFSGKTNTQSKLFQQFFYSKYNISTYSLSHKISSYLKNEICTRAP